MIEYIWKFVLMTGGMVAFLYLMFFYLKQGQGVSMLPGGQPKAKGQLLQIEQSLMLEPRKRLHVIRYGGERFLVSTTMDRTEMLTRLETPVEPEYSVIPEGEEASGQASAAKLLPGQPKSTYVSGPLASSFMGRFQQSLKMVILDRFAK